MANWQSGFCGERAARRRVASSAHRTCAGHWVRRELVIGHEVLFVNEELGLQNVQASNSANK